MATLDNTDRRHYKRFQIDGGFLFSDSETLIEPARVVDISRGGFKCMSLSQVTCPIDWIDGVELYDAHHNFTLIQLRCKMVRCSQNISDASSYSTPYSYIFAFEFCPSCNTKTAILEYIL